MPDQRLDSAAIGWSQPSCHSMQSCSASRRWASLACISRSRPGIAAQLALVGLPAGLHGFAVEGREAGVSSSRRLDRITELFGECIERRPDKRRKVAVESFGRHTLIDRRTPGLRSYRNRLSRIFGWKGRLTTRLFLVRPFRGTAGSARCTVGQSKRDCRFAGRPRLVGKLPRDGGSASTDESQQKRMTAVFALRRAALVLRWRVQLGGTIRTSDCRHGSTLWLQHGRQCSRKQEGSVSQPARHTRRPSSARALV
jgi:hypothetical protein